MSRVAVVMYRCDGCKTTGEPEPYPENSRMNPRLRKEWLPEGWAEIRSFDNHGCVTFELQVCADCRKEASRLLLGMTLNVDDHQNAILNSDRKDREE